MHCPYCGQIKSEVVETRDNEDLDMIRRRRSCLHCEKRFTTYERIENVHLLVIKRDGRREQYSIDKLRRGVLKSCEKTKISMEQIDNLVGDVTRELRAGEKTEIESRCIGDAVAKRLKELDKVAYIRFASVFKRFVDPEDFKKEINLAIKN
ncbi:MAG TPA: transcriptional regulator NrdR [Patescibacteria group bacterium]|nr:transcriptional regulator NrdR [Patescibacteria group bacterium]